MWHIILFKLNTVVISPLILFAGKNARNKYKHVTKDVEKKGGMKENIEGHERA
jgi:hypothetical protein